MDNLTNRQRTILGLVVREYVKVAEPVSSRALVEHYGLGVSSATVRNELARLEELGYLTHPHTSAGRVPTSQGYRRFVQELLGEVELPLRERRTITHQFSQVPQGFNHWMPLAASVLAKATSGASLVTAPQAERVRYKHLQLISTQGRVVLLVLVLQGGMVKQQMLDLVEPLDQTTLSEISDRLNQSFNGMTADEIGKRIDTLASFESDVARLVADMMARAEMHALEPIYRDGLSEVLQQPEFAAGEEAQGVLRIVEEPAFLEMVLADVLGPEVGGVNVLIGGEGRWEELRACSLVFVRYGVPDYATGALGVVGPTRMFYGRAISAVRFVAALLSDLVYDMYAE